jgi:hypothetical protein
VGPFVSRAEPYALQFPCCFRLVLSSSCVLSFVVALICDCNNIDTDLVLLYQITVCYFLYFRVAILVSAIGVTFIVY